jgi:hypothetical protein
MPWLSRNRIAYCLILTAVVMTPIGAPAQTADVKGDAELAEFKTVANAITTTIKKATIGQTGSPGYLGVLVSEMSGKLVVGDVEAGSPAAAFQDARGETRSLQAVLLCSQFLNFFAQFHILLLHLRRQRQQLSLVPETYPAIQNRQLQVQLRNLKPPARVRLERHIALVVVMIKRQLLRARVE